MRRSFPNGYPSEDERMVSVKRDEMWLRPSLDQIITLQNKLRVTVAQNCDDIMITRQENIVISENVRAAAGMYKQLSDQLMRLDDRATFEKSSLVGNYTVMQALCRRFIHVNSSLGQSCKTFFTILQT